MSLLIEIVLCVALLGVLIKRYLGYKKGDKYSLVSWCFISVAAFTLLFFVIHLCFCYQFGFPASIMQDDNIHLTLSAADWLGFLGGYLGFAGSLVMAILVYFQSEKINKLTISEYKPFGRVVICSCKRSNDCHKYNENDIIQYPCKDSVGFYTYHCEFINEDQIQIDPCNTLLFFEIVNDSKSVMHKLSFSGIKITTMKQSGESNQLKDGLCVNKRDHKWDPLDKKAAVYPGSSLKRCVLLKKVPDVINPCWMTIYFSYDQDLTFSAEYMIYKNSGEPIGILNISE